MRIIGVILIVLGLIAAVVPQFTDCQSQGRAIELANGKTIPMKCHWTAEAELAVAVPLIAVGGMMWFSKRKETQIVLSILGIILGVFIVLIPTYLIGVCSSFEMICNSLMKPTLILMGTVAAIASLVGLGLANRGQQQAISSSPS